MAELIVEGKPFWDSFFGYHNFQRLTSVVNSHQEPWWYFLPVLVISSLPFTSFLFLGLAEGCTPFREKIKPSLSIVGNSLKRFACCWLIVVFLLGYIALKMHDNNNKPGF